MNMLLDALGYVGSSLDKPGATVRGLLGGQGAGALANLIPFSDTAGLTNEADRVSGRGLLERYGLVKPKEEGEGFDFGDALGMGTEFLTDPLTWAGGLGLGKVAKANRLAEGNNTMRAQSLLHNQNVGELLKGGAMPEEVAKATRAVDEAGKPLATYHGTAHAFDKYDLSKMDPQALYGPGIYTTVNPEVASEYTTKGALEKLDLSDRPAFQKSAEQMLGHLPQINEQELAELTQQGVRGRALQAATENQAKRVEAMKALAAGNFDAINQTGWDINELRHFDEFKPHVLPAPMNVRKQFLDVRNPFDLDKRFSYDEYDKMMRGIFGENPAPGGFPVAGGRAQDIYDALEGAHYHFGEDIPAHLEDLSSRAMANELLKSLGYDSIKHTGGGRMGDVAHQVYIAFDPKQVYQPLVAPPLKQVPEFMAGRRYSPLLAVLGADQSLARSRGLFQGEPLSLPTPSL
jgi:hypothetical protein